jgi:nucleotide-binding universal stress UspA family protein
MAAHRSTEPAEDRIVVGIDGSEGSRDAFRWAVGEARRRHVIVEAVHVWHQAWVAPTHIMGDVDFFAAKAREVLDAVVDAVDSTGVTVERKLLAGAAAPGLIHEAKGAELVVVGSRGRGGFTGLLLGSVSQQVAHHTPCPLVIVPPEAEPAGAGDDG